MAKETFYFSHDYNARNDMKIKRLIVKHGYAGYGIFWAIVEDLYNNGNCLPTDFETIAYDLRCSDDLVRSVVMDFDLFKIDGDEFGSSSIEGRLNKRSNKSNAGKATADARWGKTNSPKRTKATKCIFYILKVYSADEAFLKVGITTESISRRYSGKLEGYSYELLFSHDDDLDKCLRIEREISAKYLRYQPAVKFAGYLECLNMCDLQAITDFAMQGFEIRNAIKESKGNDSKEKIVKESKSINTSGEPSSLLFGQIKNYFLEWYRDKKGSEYYFQAKDGAAIKSLIKKIEFSGREKNPENSDAKKLDAFKWLLENLPEWIFNSVSLPKIDSQFNQIKDNGTSKKVIPINQSPTRNISPEYLADLARRSGAGGSV